MNCVVGRLKVLEADKEGAELGLAPVTRAESMNCLRAKTCTHS